MRETHNKTRAVLMTALLIVSVFAGAYASVGTVAAADATQPGISDFTVTNTGGQDLQVSFNSSEELSDINATVSGVESASLDFTDFDGTNNTENADAGNWTYTATYSGSTDGDYTVTLDNAKDLAGNEGANGQSATVTVDTSAPTVTISSPSDGSTVQSQDTISGTVSDSTSSISAVNLTITNVAGQYWNGTGWNTSSATVAATVDTANDNWSYDSSAITTDDDYTVVATATDAAGNTGNSASVTYTLDSTAPSVSSVTLTNDDGDSVVEEGDNITVEANVDPTAASVEADVSAFGGNGALPLTDDDGDDVYNATFTVGATGTSEGSHTVEVTATDDVGNVGTNTSNELTLDTEAPAISNVEISADDGDGIVTGGDTVTVNATVNDVSTRLVEVDAGAFGIGVRKMKDTDGDGVFNTTFTVDTTATTDGTWNVSVSATDATGVSATKDSNTLVLDSTAPSATHVEAQKNSTTVTMTFDEGVYNATSGDLTAAAFKYQEGNVDSNPNEVVSVAHTAGSETVTITLKNAVLPKDLGPDAVHIIEASVFDKAGNSAGAPDVDLKDTVAPTVSDYSVTSQDGSDEVTVSFNASEHLKFITVDLVTNDGTNQTLHYEVNTDTPQRTFDEVVHADGTVTYTGTFTNVDDGNYVANLTTAKDFARDSNSYTDDGESAKFGSVEIDTTGPVFSDIEVTNDGSDVTVAFNSTDVVSKFNATLYNGSNGVVAEYDFSDLNDDDGDADYNVTATGLDDGVYYLVFENATDDFGNDDTYENVVSEKYTLDTTAPVVSDFNATENQEMDIWFNSSEPLSAINVTVDAAWNNDSDAELDVDDFAVTENGDGTYKYVVKDRFAPDDDYTIELNSVTDNYDNENTTVHSAESSVDAWLPQIVDADIVGWDGSNTTIEVTFSEHVQFDGIGADNVTINGSNVASVTAADNSKTMTVEVNGAVQTGDVPTLAVDNSTYSESSADHSDGAAYGSTKEVSTLELDLQKGKNFVSVPATTGVLDVSTIDMTHVESIWTYENGHWKIYNGDLSEIRYLEGGQGYIFVMSQSTTMDVNVYNTMPQVALKPGEQHLSEGWNLVGHWQEGDQEVNTGLSSLNAHFRVYGYDGGFVELGDTDTMHPGDAYWVFVQDGEVYTEAPY